MKKKLLALAIAGAFVAPVAMADTSNVTLYGQANVSYTHSTNGDAEAPVATNGTSANQITSEASRIGVKGSEDLGGGTSAIWQIESQVNFDNSAAGGSTGVLGTRNTFAGLKSESLGTLVFGKNDATYKSEFRGLDVFADTVADNRSLMGGNHYTTGGFLDARNTDSVTYTSPEMSGFRVSGQVVAAAENATTSVQKKGTAMDLSASYSAGPIYAAAAWAEVKLGSALTGLAAVGAVPNSTVAGATAFAADDKLKAWRLGGGYKMDQFTVNAIYEHIKSDITGATADAHRTNLYYVGGKFNVSANDAVKLAYTHRGNTGTGGLETQNDTSKQVSLGYDHAMSKRTTLYALYTKMTNDRLANASLGVADATSAAQNAAVGTGADPSAFVLGMKHSF